METFSFLQNQSWRDPKASMHAEQLYLEDPHTILEG